MSRHACSFIWSANSVTLTSYLFAAFSPDQLHIGRIKPSLSSLYLLGCALMSGQIYDFSPPINRHFIKACNHLTFTAAILANATNTKLALSDTITGRIGPVLTPINYRIAPANYWIYCNGENCIMLDNSVV